MNQFKYPILLLLIISFLSTSLSAQINGWELIKEIIQLSANATKVSDNCFQLTEDRLWAGGSIYYPNKIDLTSNFKMELDVNLGCKDEDGADGIVFVFSPKMAMGRQGVGIGYEGISPSVGIEIDTWQNEEIGDPAADHIAILQNGQIHHRQGLTRPITLRNVEDCEDHRLVISWNAADMRLSVNFDGQHIIALEKDIVQDLFGGASEVFWGVTAATGGSSNTQKVCFENINFRPASAMLNSTFKKIELALLENETVALVETKFKAGSPNLPETTITELDELAFLLKKQPSMHLGILSHTDGAGKQDKALSKMRAEKIADYLVEQGIDRNRLKAQGLGSRYATANPKQKNRIEVYLYLPLP